MSEASPETGPAARAEPLGPAEDRAAISAQLGRPARSAPDVAYRCNLQLPVVVRMPPVLASGEPFPTRFWMTCPLLHKRISRLEADGEVRRLDGLLETDAEFAEQMRAAHQRYAAERDALVPAGAVRPPIGGVAGIRGGQEGVAGVKCLHAHTADFLAGNSNPVGEEISQRVLPAHCPAPCVVPSASAEPPKVRWERNSSWSEPPRAES